MKKLSQLTSLVYALTKLTVAFIGFLEVIIKLVDMAGNYSRKKESVGEKVSVVSPIRDQAGVLGFCTR